MCNRKNAFQGVPRAIPFVVFPLSTGVVVGVVLRYAFPNQNPDQFYLAVNGHQCNDTVREFLVGDNVVLATEGGDSFRCSISGKVFKSSNGDNIEDAVSLLDISVLGIIVHFTFINSCYLILSCSFLFYCLPLYSTLAIVFKRYVYL